ncbi:MAG: cation-transporting P-type ATPase [Candidatus Methylomirabilis oxygeniifera]|uniref:Calcium-transporting ATPase n=1 Tax=Methylomirabilis oxygeniifera TaxID=671143 RepID=D5MMV3_METO1|nr:MAG: cation-transporting P-type ATPase [Candidatus Methylomirabilis oxyfera]CBE68053.1 Calcium-transporting ATPase [Candidatus Methylomirabilis oxyfera]
MQIHRLSVEEALKALGTTDQGLSEVEAERRLREFGLNALQAAEDIPVLAMLGRQCTHFLALLLWAAAALAFVADWMKPGEGMDLLAWAIIGVIGVNALFSFVQEYKAERAIIALRRLLPMRVKVVRTGGIREVPASDLVPGDLTILAEGDRVPADGRVIAAVQFRVDNAPLTGESIPKSRTAEAAAAGSLAESANIVFAGTTVLSGTARVAIFATGMNTEFGKIAHLTSGIEAELSPLQHEIRTVTRLIAAISIGIGFAFFGLGVLIGRSFWENFVFAVGLLVANVPEGLLPTVTLALAVGGQRMAKRKALVKNLVSVETLGCATVICTDKTGTLTENRMAVTRIYIDGCEIRVSGSSVTTEAEEPVTPDLLERWAPLFAIAVGCNNAGRRHGEDGAAPTFVGDPTEIALLQCADALRPIGPDLLHRVGEFPFDADRKRMTTIHAASASRVAYVKGAPETVLPICRSTFRDGRAIPLGETERQAIVDRLNAFAGSALRVLALAYRELPGADRLPLMEEAERDLTFVGLIALFDPPRPEVPEAVARCKRAGIKPIMITGDNSRTALAIARTIGMVRNEKAPVLEGSRIEQMRDEDLKAALAGPEILFARMTPTQKMRVVTLLKEMGEVVAVTGDGVNDAPALKKADIGIAMGIAGTDVAKEAADIVLLDDNFATIVNAVEEGRAVYENIRKFVTYILASNIPEIVPYLASVVLRIPLLLTIIQILAVDLGTDMLPALGLGAEPPDANTMDRAPRSRNERLLNFPLLARSYLFLGPIEAAAAMSAGLWYLTAGGWEWGVDLPVASPLYRQATTVAFAAIVICQVANVYVCRSPRTSILSMGLFTNWLIVWGIAVELLILGLIVYSPIGHRIFGTDAFPAGFWWLLIGCAVLLLLVEEARKGIVRRLDPVKGLRYQEGTA